MTPRNPVRGRRREQIIQAAISVMADRGINGTTTRLIAERVGVSEPALYKHFSSKKEIILAALQELGNRPLRVLLDESDPCVDVRRRILDLSSSLYEFVMNERRESSILFEVLTGARDPEIQEALRGKFVEYKNVFQDIFEEGKKLGKVRKDLDSSVTAWQIISLGTTLLIVAMVGLEKELPKEKALKTVEDILEGIIDEDAPRKSDGVVGKRSFGTAGRRT
jgi:AcrR family transcriptional regulator